MSKSEPFRIISITYNEGLSREEMSNRLCEHVPEGWVLRGEPYRHHGTTFMVVAPPVETPSIPSPYISAQMERAASDRLLAQIDALTIQARNLAVENENLKCQLKEAQAPLYRFEAMTSAPAKREPRKCWVRFVSGREPECVYAVKGDDVKDFHSKGWQLVTEEIR